MTLTHENIEGPRCCWGADKHATLPFVQRLRKPSRAFVHHAINYTIEKQFQCARNVAPIARCGNHECITIPYQLQDALWVVVGQHTESFLPALHTSHTRCDIKFLHFNHPDLYSMLHRLVRHCFHHLWDIALLSWACVENQQILCFHFFFCKTVHKQVCLTVRLFHDAVWYTDNHVLSKYGCKITVFFPKRQRYGEG